jgi:hypothetical protein
MGSAVESIGISNPFKKSVGGVTSSIGNAVKKAAGPQGPLAITGLPSMPDFSSPFNASGKLKSMFTVGTTPISKASWGDMKSDIGRLRGMATDTGQSDILKSQLGLLQSQTEGAQQNMLGQASSGYQTALSRAASSGGALPGASERLARMSSRDAMLGGQDILRQQAEGGLNLTLADQQRKDTIMQNLPGMSQNYATGITGINQFNASTALDANRFNKAAALGGLAGVNAFNLDRFKTQMQALGAERSADAMSGGGGGGGIWDMFRFS